MTMMLFALLSTQSSCEHSTDSHHHIPISQDTNNHNTSSYLLDDAGNYLMLHNPSQIVDYMMQHYEHKILSIHDYIDKQ